MDKVRSNICKEAFEESSMENETASCLAGRKDNILDIRAEGSISPENGRL